MYQLSLNLVIALFALTFMGCTAENAASENSFDKNTNEKSSPTELARPVKVMTVGGKQQHNLRKFPAIVEAFQQAEMTFRVPGKLTQFMVQAGDTVEQGQLIAKLDANDYQVAHARAEAHHKLAVTQFKRTQKLHQEKLISATRFDQASAEFETAEANLKAATLNLQYTQLKAPFAGQISQRHVDNFENVVAGQPIVTLQAIDQVDVAIQVPENFLASVREEVDYQPNLYFDSHKDQIFTASLKEFDMQSDPVTQTYRFVFTLPTPENFNVLPGMTATLLVEPDRVLRTTSDNIHIPSGAVFSDGDTKNSNHFVWVVTPEMVLNRRQIDVAEFDSTGVFVEKGLQFGEQIVVAGVSRLHENQSVKVWTQERGL